MKKGSKNVLRAVSFILALVMIISLTDVGTAEAKTKAKNKKDIVVLYFSGTGTTKATARRIGKKTKGKVLEIKAKEPYTEEDLDYGNDDSVVKEHESAASPAQSTVRPEIANLKAIKKAVKKADVVYIGYAGGIIGLN